MKQLMLLMFNHLTQTKNKRCFVTIKNLSRKNRLLGEKPQKRKGYR